MLIVVTLTKKTFIGTLKMNHNVMKAFRYLYIKPFSEKMFFV